ncbi:MAG: oxidoreductase [Acidimicrobiia bacterium]|nr:MAG: oxidoreductase [Acidimicrobiia bacterium]
MVKVGLIGVGWWGKVLARAAASTGELEVASVFARTPERRRAAAEELGCRAAESLEQMLSDPEIEGVMIATSHRTHADLIEQAASAGKDIFVEKPLAPTVEEARRAVDAAAKAGVALQVGHQRRRTAAAREMKRLAESGRLGDLQTLQSDHHVPNGFKMPNEAWRWNPEESPLGSMTSLGIHSIDTFMYLAGPIARVSTFTRRGRDVTIDEATGLLFEFESGAVGTLLTSFFVPRLIRLSVHGTGGAAYSDYDGERLWYQDRDDPAGTEVELDPVDPVVDQLREFARVIRDGVTPEVGGEEGLEVVAVLEAAVASAEQGRAVEVAEYRG